MLGANHFITKNPLGKDLVAAISLDNVGRFNAEGMHIAAIGQKSGYTPLWLANLAQKTADKINVWRPVFPDLITQIMERAILISFTDQGPLLAHGVPSLDFGVTSPDGWPYYHSPQDTVDKISPQPMSQVGLLTEALIREIDNFDTLPATVQPFLYFNDSNQPHYLSGIYIKLIILSLLFPLLWLTIISWQDKWQGIGSLVVSLVQIFLNALPFIGGLLSLYLAAAVNLIPLFSYYPAPPKDPVLMEVHWPALALMLSSILLLGAVSMLVKRKLPRGEKQLRPIALTVLLAVSASIFWKNPFSLLFIIPALYLWPLILPQRNIFGKLFNFVLFFSGGIILYLLLYIYSLQIYVGGYMLWYFVQMLAFKMIAPHAALAGILTIASGITIFQQKKAASVGYLLNDFRKINF